MNGWQNGSIAQCNAIVCIHKYAVLDQGLLSLLHLGSGHASDGKLETSRE